MSIGWGIVGIGRHAERFMADAIQRSPDGELVAAWSRDRARAEAFAGRFGARRAYDDMGLLLADPQVQAVLVLTPNALHVSHTVAAARAGKHVLCEKPMALSVTEGQEMLAACRAAGVRLGIGFHLRHHPAIREARRRIAEGTLGELRILRVSWDVPDALGHWSRSWKNQPDVAGGGILYGNGVHALDAVRYVTGREFVEVAAFCDGSPPAGPVEETVVALLKLEGGAYLVADFAKAVGAPTNDLEVYGARARLDGRGVITALPAGELAVATPEGREAVPLPPSQHYVDEIQDFNRAVLDGREPAATGLDGLRMVEVSLALFEAARSERAVRVGQHL
ncbi:MAG: Gfo/Idh/MocA family oxidoreductase [Chloroflexi bacterium]|nr:Gfo/Idh/MocA family oxidoreductase [Chloroflexota bacterium]